MIALGQTATVLAYDLHISGIRALDIGHIDIEYMWFLQGAKEKIAVAGKFVKEVEDQMDGEEDADYLNQIVAKINTNNILIVKTPPKESLIYFHLLILTFFIY